MEPMDAIPNINGLEAEHLGIKVEVIEVENPKEEEVDETYSDAPHTCK